MTTTKTKVNEDGRMLIPAEVRKALGLKAGETVLLTVEDDTLRVVTLKRGLRRAQALLRRYVSEDTALAESLIAERRREAKRG
jgi:AbrB family looped-hinge helix DNA binding protein